MKEKIVLAVLGMFLIFHPSFAKVMLPRLISDGMVMQRNIPLSVWGWADVDEKIYIDFVGQRYETVTDEEGKWRIQMPAMEAGGPYKMMIRGEGLVEIENIMIGEVWVCSGQSNMELPVYRVAVAYPGLIENASNPNIRHFGVATTYRFKDEADDFLSGEWEETTPENIRNFSAVGYFFARALYEKYNVPIGLIRIAVGGSPAEAWLTEETLKKYPEDYQTLQKYKDDKLVDSIRKYDAGLVQAWNQNLDDHDAGLKAAVSWMDDGVNFSRWEKIRIPGMWTESLLSDSEQTDSKRSNGVIWLKKEVEVSSDQLEKPAMLVLGALVDRDEAYINGVKVGTTGYRYPPRRYPVPAGVLRAGKNTITVRLVSNSGPGGFVPDKFYGLVMGKDTLNLEGDWYYKVGCASAPLPGGQVTFHYQPGGLFNALVAPLKNYQAKGVIWYQGESNVGQPQKYFSLMEDLVADWRTCFESPDLPFLYVQLTNFLESKEVPEESDWAELREAQLKLLSVPNTGMAVIIDAGEWNDIHPLDKKTVGDRLALAAHSVAYGEDVVYSGPIWESMTIKRKKAHLTFSHTGSGLVAKGSKNPGGFAISEDGETFRWAKAKIKNGKVVVWSKKIKNPVSVRYAWADNPIRANLYNKEGLPASPFRTDMEN